MKKKSICKMCNVEFKYNDTSSKGLYCSKECRYKDHSTIIKQSYTPELKEQRKKSALNHWKINQFNINIKKNSSLKKKLDTHSKDFKKGRVKLSKLEESICKQCHKKFEYYTRDKKGLFCSNECRIKFSKENASSYRIKAFELLPNECFYCGETSKTKLLVHHKDKNFLNNDIDNLQILCKRCHSKEHNDECIANRFKEFKDGTILRGIRMILDGLRLDLNDPNFKETPQRILRSYYEMFANLNNPNEVDNILSVTFPTDYSGMITESPIRCYSMCPHHFLPVIYDVSIGYIPKKGGLGLSKLPRLIEHLAKAPKLQEDFTKEIIDCIKKSIDPLGAIISVKGEHLCMQMRGVKKPGCATTTTAYTGVFDVASTRKEFFDTINL
jgi:GTP cyclohydrolase IA